MPAYLEIGANNGAWMSHTLLREKKSRPEGSPLPRSLVIEPNPRHATELGLLVQRYGTQHKRAAAWSSDGQMTFHFRGNDETSTLFSKMSLKDNKLRHLNCSDPKHSPQSFARLATPWATDSQIKPPATWERRPKFKRRFICDEPRAEEVETIDLARFVLDWTRPCERLHGKMDVEGAEYEVLSHLLRRGAACSFVSLQVEFHQPNLQLKTSMNERGNMNQSAIVEQFRRSCPNTSFTAGWVGYA